MAVLGWQSWLYQAIVDVACQNRVYGGDRGDLQGGLIGVYKDYIGVYKGSARRVIWVLDRRSYNVSGVGVLRLCVWGRVGFQSVGLSN